MAVNLSFIGGAGWQFFDDSGLPLSGGKIYTYAAGTTTPLTTYTSRDGLTANANPIILDAAGRTPQQIWSTEGLLYKYVVTKSNDVQIRVWDNIGGSVVPSDLAQDLANTTNNSKGDALIGFRQSSAAGFLTGAVAKTVNDKLQETLSVKDFGAVGDGFADDTAAIQSAFNAADLFSTVIFPAGTYLITSTPVVAQNKNLCLFGFNAILKAGADSISLIQYGPNDTRTAVKTVSGLLFDGNGFQNVIGFDQVGYNLKLVVENCFFKLCYIGCNIAGSMESSVINCGTFRNTFAGIQVLSTADGGGNGNVFMGNILQEDPIGYLFYGEGVYPFENNAIFGGVIQGSGFCGVAVFNGTATITGAHFEAIGLSANSTFPVYTSTASKAGAYCKNGWVSISDISSGMARDSIPQILLENSRGVVRNVAGFGATTTKIFSGDYTSSLDYIGSHDSVGLTDVYLTSWPASLGDRFVRSTFKGTPNVKINCSIPNIYASDPQVPLLTNSIGATVTNVVADNRQGFASQAVFLPAPGSTQANRVIISALPTTFSQSAYYICSFLLRSSAVSSFTVAFDFSLCSMAPTIGTEWTRIVMAFQPTSSNTSAGLYIFPNDSAGATLKVAKFHAYLAPNYDDFRHVGSEILNGHWNPNKQNQLNGIAAPTTGTWVLGDMVYNTAPTSGGYVGWICTAAGTPGTWRTFGPIS